MSGSGPDPRTVGLYDAALPAITAGDYVLKIEQTVTMPGKHAPTPQPAPYSRPPYLTSQALTVTGPRFGFAPSDAVALFPPAGSDADWSTVLPHVVLSRATLPWEIRAGAPAGRGTPWLALLLLSLVDREIVVATDGAAASATGAQTVALKDYLSPPATMLGPDFVHPTKARLLADYPDPGFKDSESSSANPGLPCVVVDVARDAWVAVAPTLADLKYLAHVRQSEATDQAVLGTGGGWFSVVAGNRLPGRAGGHFVVHLVSLEGFAATLPGGDRSPDERIDAVRLLSLARWEFTSRPGRAQFRRVMSELSTGTLRMPAAAPPAAAARPAPAGSSAPPARQAVEDALAQGYVGLPHATREGRRETAWYRGPCHPFAAPAKRPQAVASADDAFLRDRFMGIVDTSRATAWQLGRLLAAANRGFMQAIAPWMRQNLANGYLLAARLEDGSTSPPVIVGTGGVAAPDAESLMQPDAVTREADELLATMLSPRNREHSLVRGLAPTVDPTGLQDRGESLPGVLAIGELRDVVVGDGDPHQQLLAHDHGARSS